MSQIIHKAHHEIVPTCRTNMELKLSGSHPGVSSLILIDIKYVPLI